MSQSRRRRPRRCRIAIRANSFAVFACFWETLERRVHLCAAHPGPGEGEAAVPTALSADYIDYLNSLPSTSPLPFHFADEHPPSPAGPEPISPRLAPVTTILDNGPPSNRIDVVLVGDGYTTGDLPTYASQAQATVNNFFDEAPLSFYKPLFNVHRVDVVSNESGVDNDPVPGINRDTALDMGFWCNGVERLLCVNSAKANSFAASAPQADQVIAMGHSTKYGGAGGAVATFSAGNGAALEVALHEVGHSLAGLADEYEYGQGPHYTGPERPEANVSIYNASTMVSLQAKWWRWLDHPEVNIYEGAYYHQTGINRPTSDSKMRSLSRPWGPVNTEQWIIQIYRRGVKPIDAHTPIGSYPSTTSFFVDPVDPVGHAMSVQWLVDNVPVPGATETTFDPSVLELSGTHLLSARVVDPTPLVRNESARNSFMTQTRTWQITDAIPPRVAAAQFEVDRPAMEVRMTFNEDVGASLEAGDLVLENLTTGATIPASGIAVVYDAAAQAASFTFPAFDSGILPDGQYRATLPAGSVADAAANALAADFSFDFRFLQGDANLDGTVNLSDFNILAANFGQGDRDYTQGDFNYDTVVNLADFNVLAGRFGQTVGQAIGRASAFTASAAQTADRGSDGEDPLHDLLV